jgi:PIN domain nuclease of toxin-antitoxin system
MKILLDTHLLLWAAEQSGRLSRKALKVIGDPANELVFSSVSVWEIAIKSSLERPDFQADARLFRRALLDNGYRELAITSEHAVVAATLPGIHRDPFDRMLVAQSQVEGLMLLTSDPTVAKYSGSIQKA